MARGSGFDSHKPGPRSAASRTRSAVVITTHKIVAVSRTLSGIKKTPTNETSNSKESHDDLKNEGRVGRSDPRHKRPSTPAVSSQKRVGIRKNAADSPPWPCSQKSNKNEAILSTEAHQPRRRATFTRELRPQPQSRSTHGQKR